MAADRAGSGELDLRAQREVVRLLREQLSEPAAPATVIETHISFVLITPRHTYKLRKAVKLDFVDFSTLARRRRDCREELRLNRRYAADLYLAVVPITGTTRAPALDGRGPVIDCAVKMRTFEPDGLWDRLAASGGLTEAHIDALLDDLVRFHASTTRCAGADRLGHAAQVRRPVLDSLDALGADPTACGPRGRLARLRLAEAHAFDELRPVFEARRRDGWVRECHGDLHLGNVTQFEGRTRLFDCIEFNRALRYIDVMSDVAFMAMDLQCRGLHEQASRFVNGYVERTGDYGGLRVLRYYIAYRALVRAKVAVLQAAGAGAVASQRIVRRHLALAALCARTTVPTVMITHGLSGSGKTSFSQSLVQQSGAIRIRADVERKRLFGLDPRARAGGAAQAAMYAEDATLATYARMCELAGVAVRSGFSVVLDATFLRRWARDAARDFALSRGLGWVILDFEVAPAVLADRVNRRLQTGVDASDADVGVLAAQIRDDEPLAPDERAFAFACAVSPDAARERVSRVWQAITHAEAARLPRGPGQ